MATIRDEQYLADLRQALEVLRRGGVIIYPSDTIWGIGCDATNSEAVRRVYDIKHRADSKALITLVPNVAMLERTVHEVPDAAYQLLDVAVDPMTIVYDRGTGVAPELLAPDGSLGVRVCQPGFAADLTAGLKRPLVSTSANVAGAPSPASFADIDPELLKAVDYVCATGRDAVGSAKPSTVIKVSEGNVIKVLRK